MGWRWLGLVLVLAAGCDGAATLVVQVRTDLPPIVELAAVEAVVELPGGPVTRSVDATREQRWGDGVRVVELEGLAAGRVDLEVRAVGVDGSVLVARPVRVELTSGVTVATVLLTRACGGVVCPAAEDAPDAIACLAGRCVRAGCIEESTEGCDAPACASAADCPAAGAACATSTCTPSGVCFDAPDTAACEDGEVCSARDGCVPACLADGPFGAPERVTGIGGILHDDPALSDDGQRMVWAAEGPARMYEGHLASGTVGYVVDRELPELLAPPITIAGGGSLSEDGLELIFRGYQGIGDDLYRAVRASPGETFGPPEALASVNDDAADFCPDVSADGLEIFFTSSRSGPDRVYRATRATPTGDTFGPASPALDLVPGGDGCASIAADRRTLAFARDGDLYLARRATPADAFGAPEAIAELDTASQEGSPELFDGGRAIAFVSNRSGDWEIWIARRACAP